MNANKKINSKQKGKTGELELCKFFKDNGIYAERTQQYNGTAGDADIKTAFHFLHVECKRVERLNIENAIKQAETDGAKKSMQIVFHRKNRGKWLATVDAKQMIEMLKKC